MRVSVCLCVCVTERERERRLILPVTQALCRQSSVNLCPLKISSKVKKAFFRLKNKPSLVDGIFLVAVVLFALVRARAQESAQGEEFD